MRSGEHQVRISMSGNDVGRRKADSEWGEDAMYPVPFRMPRGWRSGACSSCYDFWRVGQRGFKVSSKTVRVGRVFLDFQRGDVLPGGGRSGVYGRDSSSIIGPGVRCPLSGRLSSVNFGGRTVASGLPGRWLCRSCRTVSAVSVVQWFC